VIETEELKVGREMDALVAEKVMGWERGDWLKKWPDGSKQEYFDVWIIPELAPLHNTPLFSTSIAAAWQVVEKLVRSPDTLRLIISELGVTAVFTHNKQAIGEGDTAPEAICLAALKAIDHA